MAELKSCCVSSNSGVRESVGHNYKNKLLPMGVKESKVTSAILMRCYAN